MANFCENHVTFKGSNQNLHSVKLIFDKQQEKYLPIDEWDLPFTVKSKKGDMTNVNWDNGTVYFQTWWLPNTDLMIEIADHFELEFESYYHEPGCEIYGQANYRYGCLSKIELDQTDFAKFRYDEDNDVYIYRRKEYDCDDEILEILLERKIKNIRSRNRKATFEIWTWENDEDSIFYQDNIKNFGVAIDIAKSIWEDILSEKDDFHGGVEVRDNDNSYPVYVISKNAPEGEFLENLSYFI